MTKDVDALIMGGGLAGSMAALRLAGAGRRVVLAEKSRAAHHKVCGEFLSFESLHYFQQQRISVQALGGVAIRTVRLAARDFVAEAELPFAAYSLTRRCLDEELLRRAEQAGAEVLRGTAASQLERAPGRWLARLQDGTEIRAADALLATGKHDLRGWPRPAGTHRGLVAFKMYFQLSAQQQAALGNAVELILFPGGYAGLQPVENGAANLCLLIHEDRLRSLHPGWSAVLAFIVEHAPHLAERLHGATPSLDAPLAASQIPYGFVQRHAPDGLWRIGDQAAVIPSFCGDGMAIALHSAALASHCLLGGQSAAHYQRRLHGQLASRIWIAARLSQMLVSFPQAARVVRAAPALLPHIASGTRIPRGALLTRNTHERIDFAQRERSLP